VRPGAVRAAGAATRAAGARYPAPVSDAVPEPVLDKEERAAFLRAVDEYNQRLFFECHDTLEAVWSGLRGPARDFFQGLIQVAVAFHHVSNGNAAGALSMIDRALGRFGAYPGRYFGFDLDAQRAELAAWRERLTRPGWEEGPLPEPGRWVFA
jgi:predicted metal-dependent hydrolase